MKKVRLLGLITFLIILCLCGCGKETGGSGTVGNEGTSQDNAAAGIRDEAEPDGTRADRTDDTGAAGTADDATGGSGIAGDQNTDNRTAHTNGNPAAQTARDWVSDPSAVHPLSVPETPLPDFTAVSELYDAFSTQISDNKKEFSKQKTASCIYITTEEKRSILSKDEYVASIVDVFNCDAGYGLSAAAGVKVRGNSTADQGDEKSYRIKFEKKQGMLGLHEGQKFKSWVLMRSFWNLAPDHMGFELAKAIFDGKYYSSDSCYVNLYINGDYKGVYLLCEQNQATKGRVEVHEPKADEYGADIGYFIEMDNYAGDEHPYFTLDHKKVEMTDVSGNTRKTFSRNYSIKSDINNEEQKDFITKYLNGCYDILYEAAEHDTAYMFDGDMNAVPAGDRYGSAKEAVEAVIDTESLANMLILEELVHNYDVGAGSFFMAVDLSDESMYERLTFLAPWDFNWAYYESGNEYFACTFQKLMDDGYDRSNIWFITAMKAEWFRDIVKDKWKALGETSAIENTANRVVNTCEKLSKDLGDEAWKVDMVKNIRTFVNDRRRWLDTQWNR
jgi:hypothetical protein